MHNLFKKTNKCHSVELEADWLLANLAAVAEQNSGEVSICPLLQKAGKHKQQQFLHQSFSSVHHLGLVNLPLHKIPQTQQRASPDRSAWKGCTCVFHVNGAVVSECSPVNVHSVGLFLQCIPFQNPKSREASTVRWIYHTELCPHQPSA